ncbi:MAG: hypothetical protein ACXWZY_10840, partial [Gaiellaceae bacterium]
DGAQVLEFVFGCLKALTQQGEVAFPDRGFLAQPCVQRVLAVLSLVSGVDVTPLCGNLGAQPPDLSFVSAGVIAHVVVGARRRRHRRVRFESSRIAGMTSNTTA